MTNPSLCFHSQPVLIAFAGLPGTGKSSLALDLASGVDCVYLRIDTIEQAIRNSPGERQAVNEEGYRVAYAIAEDNLRLGRTVVSDSVNPVQETRDGWKEVAQLTNAIFVEVEVICSDPAIHRERVETRSVGIPGLRLPSWEEVVTREFQPWTRDHIVIDTARKTLQACGDELRAALFSSGNRPASPRKIDAI